MQVGETFVKVRADTRGFGSELQAGVQGQAAGAGQSLGQELGGAISRGLATVVAGGAAVNFLRSAVDEASALNEAVSLTGNVFQQAGGQIVDMSEESAQSMGLAQSEALEYANAIGGLFIGFGDTREQAAAMSQDILQLGADLASAKNLTGGTAEALEVLRSGLVGEVEPLRRIGVALNAASVEQRALTDTGKQSADQLTEGEKAAARYALILESLTAQGVVGDFARTAEGAANQQRILNAELTNAKAELGQQLLPTYIAFIGAIREGIPLLDLVGQHLAGAADGAGLLAAALGPLVTLTNNVNEGLLDMSAGTAGLTSLTGPLGQLTAIVEQARRVFDQGIDLGSGTIGSGEQVGLVEDFRGGIDGLRAAMELLNLEFGGDGIITIEEWAAAVQTFAVETGRSFEETLQHIGIEGAAAAEILRIIGDIGSGAGASMGQLAAETERVNDQASRGDLGQQADALHEVAEAADEARQMLEDLYGIQQSLDEANADVQASADALTASLQENGRNFDISTEAGRANMDAAREAASAIREQTIAARANGATVEEASASNRFLTESLRRQLLQAGLSREETNRLIETYGRVPRRVLSTIEQNGADAVRTAAGLVKGALDAIPKNIQISIGSNIGAVAGDLGALANQVQNLPPGLAPQGRAAGGKGPTPRGREGDLHVHVHAGVVIGGDLERAGREIAPSVAREIDRLDRGA